MDNLAYSYLNLDNVLLIIGLNWIVPGWLHVNLTAINNGKSPAL